MAFRNVTSCSLVDRYQRFGGTYYLHLQGRIWREQVLRNVGTCVPNYTASCDSIKQSSSPILFVIGDIRYIVIDIFSKQE